MNPETFSLNIYIKLKKEHSLPQGTAERTAEKTEVEKNPNSHY